MSNKWERSEEPPTRLPIIIIIILQFFETTTQLRAHGYTTFVRFSPMQHKLYQ